MSVIEERTETVALPVTRRDVLHRAADILEEWGWKQRASVWDGMTHRATCLLGAVHLATIDLQGRGGRSYISPLCDTSKALDGAFGAPQQAWRWNDEPGRTKAEVVALLREAAEQV